SAATVRRHHPDAIITTVVDGPTASRIGSGRDILERFGGRLVVVDGIQGDAKERSRILKTTMRRYVTGRFIFLDLDTLVVVGLDALFRTEGPCAIALDYESGVVDERDREIYMQLDPAHYPERAFNSGVMAIDDSPQVSQLFEEWHQRWLVGRTSGRVDDQPS